MKKSILHFGKALDKAEQQTIQGGSSCPQIDPDKCTRCGGFPLTNGCCLGDQNTWACLQFH